MNSELKILKEIWKVKGGTSLRTLSHQTGFGLAYIYHLCNYLSKKGQIKPVKGKRDCYEITSQGEKVLKQRGITKLDISSSDAKARKSDTGIEAEEKKLNLGKAIEKAVSYLRNIH